MLSKHSVKGLGYDTGVRERRNLGGFLGLEKGRIFSWRKRVGKRGEDLNSSLESSGEKPKTSGKEMGGK